MPRRGRPDKGSETLSQQIYVRVTLAQLAAFAHLGGSKWLRDQIDAAMAEDRDLPTAHQPFPVGLSVHDAVTGKPIPYTVTIREY